MYMAYIIYLVLYHSTFVSSIKGPHCIVKALGFLFFSARVIQTSNFKWSCPPLGGARIHIVEK